jgi:2-polyprenyl-3-methyl-5-hydroxy-6-metoxy-1,4-benzoquinol methylase
MQAVGLIGCSVCGTEAHYDFAHSGYDFYACRNPKCRHVFVHPTPTHEDLRALYEATEASIANSDSWTTAQDYKSDPEVVRRYYRPRIAWLQKHGCFPSASSAILDIGCSTGMFLRVLKDEGYMDLHGLDLSALHCDYVKTQHGIPCAASIDALAGKAFDLITCYAVLEHTREPMSFLRDLMGLLKPGGKMVILVPNYRGFYRVLAGSSWVWLIPPVHLQYFGPDSLAMAIQRTRLILRREETNYSGTCVYLLTYHLLHFLKRPMVSTTRTGRSAHVLRLVNAAESTMRVVLLPVSLLAGLCRQHNELTCIAEKPA